MRSSIVAVFAVATCCAAALGVSPAGAAQVTQPVQSLSTCAAGGLSRVAFTPQSASCCNGAMNCPQLLSTTGLVRAKRVNRT